jgi:hypothetical protein
MNDDRPAEGVVIVRGTAEGFVQEIVAGSHRFLSDEPERAGVTDTGPTSYDLLLAHQRADAPTASHHHHHHQQGSGHPVATIRKATYRKMIQNLWCAAGYNIVAIPLAAGVLAPWGIVLHPAVGAVLMSLSTVVVAINAQLLRGARL